MNAGQARAVTAWKALKSPRLGMRGYLCVLAYLTAGPATTIDLAADFGQSRQHTRELVNRMGELGMVHTDGEVRTGRAGPLTPVWRAGPGPVVRGGCACRQRFPELMQLRRILAGLEDPQRTAVLAAETGSHAQTVIDLMAIGNRLQLVHICAWDMPSNPQGGGAPVPCWVVGPGRNAPRPGRVGNAEVKRRWRVANAARRHTEQIMAALRAQPQQVAA